MTTFVITLPGIDTRYTAQWYQYIVRYIVENKRTDILALGTNEKFALKPTEFLNYREYMQYVFPQLIAVLKLMKDGDIVFFMDGETPGLEAVEYVRKMEGIDVEIRAYWHAGTYDKNDLTYTRGIQGENFERGWFGITDKLFVGSEYHKRLLCEERGVAPDKITVTGSPIDIEAVKDGSKTKKTRKYLFAGRKVAEKGYDIVQELQRQGVDITVSFDNQWSKGELYQQIAQSEILVNPSRQETFGFVMMEAFASNVPAIVPDTPQFETIVPAQYRVSPTVFNDKEEFECAAKEIIKGAGNEKDIARKYDFHKVMAEWFKI